MEREHPMNPDDPTLPRILLVEDDPVSQAFLATAIEALPAIVDRAASLAAARKLAAGHVHALWLVDANLPDGRGADLLSQLRAELPDTPALAHTAAHDRHALDALIDAGFLQVLVKPLSENALQAAINDALGAAASAAMTTGAELPPWDDAAALSALNRQPESVDALRKLFLEELPAQRRSIAIAAADDDITGMRSILHRMRASCGFVGASRLDAAVRALEADLQCVSALRRFEEAAGELLSA